MWRAWKIKGESRGLFGWRMSKGDLVGVAPRKTFGAT
jgi:hypothetical protein